MSTHPAARILPTVGWGIFCAASWTWCIGMFLPIIMLRDDGWIGFLAFAIPNAVGCAAFGYVRSRRACRIAWHANAPAVRLFSFVTVAYQLFFVGFVLTALTPGSVSPFAVGIIVLLIAAYLGGHRGSAAPSGGVSTRSATGIAIDRGRVPWPTLMLLGVLAWIVSIVVLAIISIGGTGGWSDFGAFGRMPPVDIAWYVPILVFGFLLCPYLDGTFHVARMESPSRHAFAVFGVAFSLMLLLSAAYASLLLRHGLVWPVLVHMLVQLTFTATVHVRVMNDLRPPTGRTASMPWLPWLLLLAAPLLGAMVVAPSVDGAADPMTARIAGEAWYLRWLALYGLVFPAVVLLLRRSPIGEPTARAMPMAIAVGVGLLLCELGFIHGHRWLVPFAVAGALAVGFWPARSKP